MTAGGQGVIHRGDEIIARPEIPGLNPGPPRWKGLSQPTELETNQRLAPNLGVLAGRNRLPYACVKQVSVLTNLRNIWIRTV